MKHSIVMNNEDTLSLRVARSGTKRPKYGRLVPAAPQCLLMFSVIVYNPICVMKSFTIIRQNIER